ncbi:MAG: hypothetical protein JNK82_10475 [Myxococcaceae bacterium]|nr:hypothetical protein [Myxococcaceae bacterium]
MRRGRLAEAEGHHRKVEQLVRARLGEKHPARARALSNLAQTLFARRSSTSRKMQSRRARRSRRRGRCSRSAELAHRARLRLAHRVQVSSPGRHCGQRACTLVWSHALASRLLRKTSSREIHSRRPRKPSTTMRTSFASTEQRIANQHRRINQGVRAGTLSEGEAQTLRGRLDRAQGRIENDAFDGNGASRLQEQNRLLNGISRDIRTQKHDDNIDPARRRENIGRRIERGLADGSLTQAEHDALKAKLDQAQTPQELQALSREVRTERHDGELDAAKRTESFNQRIQAGVADGSLTTDEAQRLTDQAGKLGTNPTTMSVNELNRAIWRERHDAQVDPAKAVESISSRIDSLEQSGRLSADQVSQLRTQLNELRSGDVQAQGPRLNILRQQLAGMALAAA